MGWAGGVCAGALGLATLVATSFSRPWHIAVILLGIVAALALLVLIGTGWTPAKLWVVASWPRRQLEPGKAITDRWLVTDKSTDVLTVSHIRTIAFSGTSYAGPPEDRPAILRLDIAVACEPLAPSPDATELRSRFRSFLTQEPIMTFLSDITAIGSAELWRSLTGTGSLMLEAAIMAEGQTDAAIAAMLLLPQAGQALGYGQDTRYAEFRLHIEPRTAEGKPVPPSKLIEWQARFTKALGIPGLLRDFLSHDLELATFNDPPAMFAILLETYGGPLTQLIDIGDLTPLPGMPVSSQFMGWAVARADGRTNAGTARDLTTSMCEHSLRLDSYQSALLPDLD